MATTPALSRSDIVAAHARLRGHLVATPVIGGLDLPGLSVPADLRIKVETLQPSGSLWFRGAVHWAMRQLGRHKGIAIDGPSRAMLAWACAAREARIACASRSAPPAEIAVALAHYGCLEAPAARDLGFVPTPDPDARDFRVGIASIVVELLEELPRDTKRVVVAPAALAYAVADGVTALGVAWRVVPGAADDARASEVRAALLVHQRVACDVEGAATLAGCLASGEPGTCVVLGV